MQRGQHMVHFIYNIMRPVIDSPLTLTACIYQTDFHTMLSNVQCSSRRSFLQRMKIKQQVAIHFYQVSTILRRDFRL